MANNRMYLRNKRIGQQVFLAKYYPSTGWYCYHEDLNHRLDKLFSDPRHVEGSDLGGNDYEVVYESICEPTSEQLLQGPLMERPDYESLSSLLEDRPLPWSHIPGLRPGESEIIAGNGKPVMRITTNVQNHQAVLDLFRYMLPHKMPELNA